MAVSAPRAEGDREVTPTSRKATTVLAIRHSGTHIIVPLVNVLTGKAVFSPKGEEGITCIPSRASLIWTRDPRNWIVSAYRWKNHGALPGPKSDKGLAKLIRSRAKGETMVEYAMRWADRWMVGLGPRVRFEDFAENPVREAEEIAEHFRLCGAPIAISAQEAVSKVWNQGTYTGKHSYWRDWFEYEAKWAWSEAGGDRLTAAMGY